VTASQELQEKYGSSFEYSNITRMIKFAARFPDAQIVVPLAQERLDRRKLPPGSKAVVRQVDYFIEPKDE